MASIIFFLQKMSETTPDRKLARLDARSLAMFMRPNMRMETPRVPVM